jgi:hypothetical protein
MINRTQALVLWFVLAAWLSLIVILVAAPEVYDEALPALGQRRAVEIAFLVLLSAFLGLLGIGVLRRWRWIFWLILIAFGLGLVRVPVAVLQLLGQLAPAGPAWYVVLQGVSGVTQFVIALAMLADYRRAGIWGAGETSMLSSNPIFPSSPGIGARRQYPIHEVASISAHRPGYYPTNSREMRALVFRSAPAECARLAAPCRESCRRTGGSPDCSTKDRNRRVR